ncbi:MAG: glycoside-pentoside-hexuronide (GPH):cation symporter [Clostridiales bacterium]|nr:glycoside-pentoside-hexuronide (GPH):cation symporter [Clostridiales bacterium]
MEGTTQSTTNIKLGFGKQIGYGFGEFAGQFFYSFWSSYLSVYYTDVVGIAPIVVSIIFMVARVWDAVNDPVLGKVADSHKHKRLGRYRPWIVFGVPVLAVLSILMFHVPNLDSSQLKIAYITITYILAGMAFTAVNIPYMGMQSTLTTNIKSRIDLSSMKSTFTCVGTIVVNLICMPIILFFSGAETANGRGYFLATIVFTLIGAVLYYITVAATKEVYYPEKSTVDVDFKTILRYLFTNKQLIVVIFGIFFSMLSMFSRLGVAVYYYIYCMNKPGMIGILMILPPLAGILPTYLVPKLNVSRRALVYVSILGRAVALFGIFLVDYTNFKAIIILLLLYGAFMYDQGLIWGMVAPAIDDAEVRTGIRLDGTVYAFTNLFVKISTAVGASAGLAIMGAMGYIANQAQTPRAMTGINIATNLLPAIFVLCGIVPFLFYKMTPEKIDENRRILEERRVKNNQENN